MLGRAYKKTRAGVNVARIIAGPYIILLLSSPGGQKRQNPSKRPNHTITKCLISRAAELLKQKPEDWVLRPSETIDYLKQLQQRRQMLEDTYLKL